jgi:hypothetical protein
MLEKSISSDIVQGFQDLVIGLVCPGLIVLCEVITSESRMLVFIIGSLIILTPGSKMIERRRSSMEMTVKNAVATTRANNQRPLWYLRIVIAPRRLTLTRS